jgi:1,3-beta-glucan synthase
LKFDRIDWNRVFFKTYYEKRSFGHLLVNFNRIWVLHISMFWFYTAYNSPRILARDGHPSAALQWSASALGGAVATVIMIAATLAEFSYIPLTWNNTSHLTRRLLFLGITLALTAGPTVYIALVEGTDSGGSLALILGIVQFFIAVVATLLFAIMPSGRMFGDRVAGKSRKYLASQTFTASYPMLNKQARFASVLMWLLIFGCKFVESYFFLTQSFREPIAAMVGMEIQGCNDRFFGDALCRHHAEFTLTIMFIMDLVLFFLDTYLWYIIWNTVYSIARSFALGLSIWTPWKDIYTRLPKRIYAKLLATADMEQKYKPKVRIVCFFFILLHPDLHYSRFWSRKSGTRSSSRCTASTCSPSTTSRSCSTTRWTTPGMAAAPSVRRRSSCLSMTKGSKANSSPLDPRRSAVSRSSPSRSRPPFRSRSRLTLCPRSRS